MIIDTSVVVKWFYEEAETSTALRLFDKIANHEVHGIIPDLLFYEFANTLKTKGKADRIDVEAALNTLYELPWVVMEPKQHLLSHALQVAERYNISVYDGCYVALALEWNVSLITADEKLFRIVGAPAVQLLRDYKV